MNYHEYYQIKGNINNHTGGITNDKSTKGYLSNYSPEGVNISMSSTIQGVGSIESNSSSKGDVRYGSDDQAFHIRAVDDGSRDMIIFGGWTDSGGLGPGKIVLRV